MFSIEEELLEEHADEAIFLWARRDAAVKDAAFDASEVAELDARLEANIDALRLAGPRGLSLVMDVLAEEASAGAVFLSMLLSVEVMALRVVASVLNTAVEEAGLSRAAIAALGYLPFATVKEILPGLLSGRCPPRLLRVGIGACAVHREDPGATLGYALLSSDKPLRARALRAVGELGRVDLAREVVEALGDEDEACRYAAAYSSLLFGEKRALDVLWALSMGGGPFAERACALLMRRMEPRAGFTYLYSLQKMGNAARVALSGAASLGDPALVPWAMESMGDPALARRAGFSITMITGLDLSAEKLTSRPPEGFSAGPTDEPTDENVEEDPDWGLAWPDQAALRGWWAREEHRFRKGTRYLWGRPVADMGWLEDVVKKGNQVARAGAALELFWAGRRRVVVEVRGRRGR